jgi:hypothetical protein
VKTRLETDDRLYAAARVRAARDHTTVSALVEEGLAVVLGLGPVTEDDTRRARQELADLEALCSQVRALPLLTRQTPDQILAYDDGGSFA